MSPGHCGHTRRADCHGRRSRALIRGDHPVLRARTRTAVPEPSRAAHPGRDLARRVPASAPSRPSMCWPQAGLGAVAYPREYGGEGDPCGAVAVFEELALGDLSVLVKYGVQFGLFGGSIAQLGTEKHHRRYLSRIASLELPGLLRHDRDRATVPTSGTSARRPPTDPTAREFVIDHPGRRARARTTSATPRCTGAWPPSSRGCGCPFAGMAPPRTTDPRPAQTPRRPRRGAFPSRTTCVHAFLVPIRDDSRRGPPRASASRIAAQRKG